MPVCVIRFVRIKDELIPQMMNEAAGYELDQNSRLHNLVYSRVKAPVFYIVQSGLPRSGPVQPFGRTEQK